MAKLKPITKIVKAILIDDERSRNSDSFLYLQVLQIYARKNGTDLRHVSVADYLMSMAAKEFPPFESVRRARQKVQRAYPELAASERVEALRAVNEREYREYARGCVE